MEVFELEFLSETEVAYHVEALRMMRGTEFTVREGKGEGRRRGKEGGREERGEEGEGEGRRGREGGREGGRDTSYTIIYR